MATPVINRIKLPTSVVAAVAAAEGSPTESSVAPITATDITLPEGLPVEGAPILETFVEPAEVVQKGYKHAASSKKGLQFGSTILRPNIFAVFYPKNEAEEVYFESLVASGILIKVGE